jgi:hypothetical protein
VYTSTVAPPFYGRRGDKEHGGAAHLWSTLHVPAKSTEATFVQQNLTLATEHNIGT